MSPFLYGGDMISSVTYEDSKWNDLPYKFEAGTPNIADSIGLGVACEYLNNVGMDNIWEHEMELGQYAVDQISISRVEHIKQYSVVLAWHVSGSVY